MKLDNKIPFDMQGNLYPFFNPSGKNLVLKDNYEFDDTLEFIYYEKNTSIWFHWISLLTQKKYPIRLKDVGKILAGDSKVKIIRSNTTALRIQGNFTFSRRGLITVVIPIHE